MDAHPNQYDRASVRTRTKHMEYHLKKVRYGCVGRAQHTHT